MKNSGGKLDDLALHWSFENSRAIAPKKICTSRVSHEAVIDPILGDSLRVVCPSPKAGHTHARLERVTMEEEWTSRPSEFPPGKHEAKCILN